MNSNKKLAVLPMIILSILSVFGLNYTKENAENVVSVINTNDKKLILGGEAIGITLESDGILVLGTGGVTGKDMNIYYPAQNILREGDIIVEVDGEKLNNKEGLESAVKECSGDLNLKIRRKETLLDVAITPIKSVDDGSNKIGVWVRDSTQGIGTLTFVDPQNRKFGALGHGVYDVDTGGLMSIKSGNIVESKITGVKRSEKGIPGEMTGVLNKSVVYGNISKNTEDGIYGIMNRDAINNFGNNVVSIANFNDVKKGKATILCTLDNGEKTEYEIEIEAINKNHVDADKGLVIRITDKRLKNRTGGIIQGMSGSPILQDGKLIGAVTHVLVNDPTKGYGIFIENMLDAAA